MRCGQLSPPRRSKIIPLSNADDLAFVRPLSASSKHRVVIATSLNQTSGNRRNKHTRWLPGIRQKLLSVVFKHALPPTNIGLVGKVPCAAVYAEFRASSRSLLLGLSPIGSSRLIRRSLAQVKPSSL